MTIQRKLGIDFGSIGVILGVLAVVSVLVAVTIVSVIRHERNDEITWVG